MEASAGAGADVVGAGGLVAVVCASTAPAQSARAAAADSASLVRRWVEEKNELMVDEVLVSEEPEKELLK